MRSVVFCWVMVTCLMIPKSSTGDVDIPVSGPGPQVTDVTLADGTTVVEPQGVRGLVRRIVIHFQDLPNRAGPGEPKAFREDAKSPVYHKYNYELVSTSGKNVPIDQVNVSLDDTVDGQPATAQVELVFGRTLRAGWHTLKVLDYLVDPEGNALDGETWGSYAAPVFPSGDGQPGRDFICRFRIRKGR